MMARRLMAINVIFAVVSALCTAYIVRQLLLPPMSMPVGRTRPAPTARLASPVAAPRPAPGAYGIVVARSVFSPTRTEATSTGTSGIASLGLKPSLFGVVLREGGSIAYLEDPVTKRVGGYRIGDAIAGGTVQSISADSVVIARPDGRVDVLLHDATRVRTVEPLPGQPVIGQPTLPGAIVPGTSPGAITPGLPNPALTPPVPGNAAAPNPTRRSLPNLLRRMPTPGDAPPQ